jgi:hypothetical protein
MIVSSVNRVFFFSEFRAYIVQAFLPAAIDDWNVQDVGTWLSGKGLSAYQPNFAKELVDGPRLLAFSEKELEQLGVNSPEARIEILAKTKSLLKERRHFEFSSPRSVRADDDAEIRSHGLNKVMTSGRKIAISPLPMLRISRWTVENVQAWLNSNALQVYLDAFYHAAINGQKLLDLTEEGLAGFGVTRFNPGDNESFQKLLRALMDAHNLAAYDHPSPSASPPPLPTPPEFVQKAATMRQRSNLAIKVAGPADLDSSSRTAAADSRSSTPVPFDPPLLMSAAMGWTVDDVGDWLDSIGFARLRAAFSAGRIHGQSLLRSTVDSVVALGVSDIDAEAVLEHIAGLRKIPAAPAAVKPHVAPKPISKASVVDSNGDTRFFFT